MAVARVLFAAAALLLLMGTANAGEKAAYCYP